METEIENVLTQHITQTLGVVGGKPRIAGSRIRVLDIVVWHEKRGLSTDQVVELFPELSLADVYAALAYYFDHRDEIEKDFLREAITVNQIRPHFPSKVHQKTSG
jgi:uncharacterized protein (DUF433 family)